MKGRPRRERKDASASHWFVQAALRFVDLLGPLLRMADVEQDKLRVILRSKLVLDLRRGRRAKAEGNTSPFSGGFLVTCAANLLFGLFAGGALALLRAPLPAVGVAQTMVMGIATLVLISDYSAVLLDTTDGQILGHAPVRDRTVFTARVLHILIYLGMVEGSLALGPLIIGSFVYPPLVFVPVYLLITVLSTALCIGLSFGFYVVALRCLDMERFKEVVLYFQIGATVVVIGGFQLLPQFLDLSEVVQQVTAGSWWTYLIPPFHQGGLMALALGEWSAGNAVLAALAILLPVVLLWITVRLASSGFTQGLAAIAVGDRSGRGHWRPSRRRLGTLLLRTRLSRAGYDFFAAMARRERQYRMRTYPMVAIALVIGLAFGLRHGADDDPAVLCGAIYLLAVYAPQFVLLARFSDDHRARWLFDVAPTRSRRPLVVGSTVAVVGSFIAPAYLVVLVVVLLAGGLGIWPDAVLATEFALGITLATAMWLGSELPFTKEYSRDVMTGQTGTFFLLTAITVVLVLFHVWLRGDPLTMYAAMIAIAFVLLVLGRRLVSGAHDRAQLRQLRG